MHAPGMHAGMARLVQRLGLHKGLKGGTFQRERSTSTATTSCTVSFAPTADCAPTTGTFVTAPGGPRIDYR